jgi:hypothetical protein
LRSTRQLRIALPNEMAQMICAKVASGECASESAAIRDGLRALQARDRAVATWCFYAGSAKPTVQPLRLHRSGSVTADSDPVYNSDR